MIDMEKARKALEESGLFFGRRTFRYEIWTVADNRDILVYFYLYENHVDVVRKYVEGIIGLSFTPRVLRAMADYEEALADCEKARVEAIRK